MFKIIVVGITLSLAAFLVYVALKPGDFRISRTQTINAAPGTVFALINNLRGFNRWNPFSQDDPALKLEYSGPETGRGAAYSWSSTGKSGQGRAEIIDSLNASRVIMHLEFIKPLSATNTAEFAMMPTGSSTQVIWSMSGTRPYSHKLMSTIFDFDKIVGGEFDKGLASLKALAERGGESSTVAPPVSMVGSPIGVRW